MRDRGRGGMTQFASVISSAIIVDWLKIKYCKWFIMQEIPSIQCARQGGRGHIRLSMIDME